MIPTAMQTKPDTIASGRTERRRSVETYLRFNYLHIYYFILIKSDSRRSNRP